VLVALSRKCFVLNILMLFLDVNVKGAHGVEPIHLAARFFKETSQSDSGDYNLIIRSVRPQEV